MRLQKLLREKIDLKKKLNKSKKLDTKAKYLARIAEINKAIDKEFKIC